MSVSISYDSGVYQSGERELVITDFFRRTTRPSIIFPPGHTGDVFGYGPENTGLSFEPARALAQAGFACFSIDGGGPTTWSGPAAQTAMGNAVAHALALFGGTKVGLFGFSMGGATSLNYLKRNSAKVAGAWLADPVTDLDYVHTTSGYFPAYTIAPAGPLAPSGWAAEAETDFSTNAAGWAAATTGWRIYDEPATFRGLCPLRFSHANDDTTLSYFGTQKLVTNINDPNVTLRGGTLTGDHVGQFANLPPSEIVAFFQSLSWS